MREEKNRAAAGVSPPEEIDVAALYEQLRAELRRGPSDGDPAGAGMAATRALAERFWPVTAEREVGGGPKGFVKRVLRKLMRWYVDPLAADQRIFNDSVLKLLDALSERADEAGATRERAERLVRELEERLARLERRGRAGGGGTGAVPSPSRRSRPRRPCRTTSPSRAACAAAASPFANASAGMSTASAARPRVAAS